MAKAPTKGLSTLNSMAFGLAVYASQCGLLQRHARLATGCWLDFAGQVYLLLNPNERFQPGIASSSPKLSQRTRSEPWVTGERNNEPPTGAAESLGARGLFMCRRTIPPPHFGGLSLGVLTLPGFPSVTLGYSPSPRAGLKP